MRRSGSCDRAQANKSANAVIHMHDDVAGIERSDFTNEIPVALAPLANDG